jgi:hypothetical protein
MWVPNLRLQKLFTRIIPKARIHRHRFTALQSWYLHSCAHTSEWETLLYYKGQLKGSRIPLPLKTRSILEVNSSKLLRERQTKEVEDLRVGGSVGKSSISKRVLGSLSCLWKQVTIFCGIIPTSLLHWSCKGISTAIGPPRWVEMQMSLSRVLFSKRAFYFFQKIRKILLKSIY